MNYYESFPRLWCPDNKDVGGRNGCSTDKECLNNARDQCDNDRGCFGVSWHEGIPNHPIKICLSRDLKAKSDGWRTMMKSTKEEEGKLLDASLPFDSGEALKYFIANLVFVLMFANSNQLYFCQLS